MHNCDQPRPCRDQPYQTFSPPSLSFFLPSSCTRPSPAHSFSDGEFTLALIFVFSHIHSSSLSRSYPRCTRHTCLSDGGRLSAVLVLPVLCRNILSFFAHL